MKTHFYDRQERSNPFQGKVIDDAYWLDARIEELRQRPPSFCELEAENGFNLLLGIGPSRGCAEYSAADGRPPYLMAKDMDADDKDAYMEFLTASTDTPVPMRYCLPIGDIKDIAKEFLRSGKRSTLFEWEEI